MKKCCRESAQTAQQAPKHKRPRINIIKLNGDKLKPTSKLYVNPTAPKSLATKLQETNLEHRGLHTAQERQVRLESQALRQTQEQEHQTTHVTQEHELATQELQRQAEEQPAIQKTLWKRQLSQQSTYKAEIHELLNMREKSEMQSHLAANMCKIEHSLPSRSVESEPENVLNIQSPGWCSRWILLDELETPDKPTSSGLQSAMGAPVQLGPSPQSREDNHPCSCCIPPAQWGDMHALAGPRCVNGQLLRLTAPNDESPSTACRANVVNAPGGVVLGRGFPGFGKSPGNYLVR